MNLHKYGTPKYFYQLAGTLLPYVAVATALLLAIGLVWGLRLAPVDYQQGESYRIMFVHVPSAWMSMFIYVVMAGNGALLLVFHAKLADMVASACAATGAVFTLAALATGSLWGKPMWGAWWVWDARLTSELILFFLYMGVIALRASIDDPRRAGRASAILALVGVVNIPVIHFSVQWWNTLHQPASISSISKIGAPGIHPSMIGPLLTMALAFTAYFTLVILMRVRAEILVRERGMGWVAELPEIKR